MLIVFGFISFSVYGLHSQVKAQTPTPTPFEISGRVVYRDPTINPQGYNIVPIAGATVTIQKTFYSSGTSVDIATVTTDANGRFRVSVQPPPCPSDASYRIGNVVRQGWTVNNLGGTLHPSSTNPCLRPPWEVGDLLMWRVKSVEWENVYDNQLTDNPTAMGVGKRMYPDKHSPTDNPTISRRVVTVKITATMIETTGIICLKLFDMDDPTANAPPVDITDVMGINGDDNRGVGALTMPYIHNPYPQPRTGFVRTTFTTSMHPGDNWAVVAYAEREHCGYSEGITLVNGSEIRDADGSTIVENETVLAKAKRTPTLYVWRRLHMEVDSMGLVTGNKVEGTISNAQSGGPGFIDLVTNQTLENNRFSSGKIVVATVGTFNVFDNDNRTVFIEGGFNPQTAIGKTFTLYDDDDFNNKNSAQNPGDNGESVTALKATLSRLQESDNPEQNVFASAYIMPINDGAGNPGNTNNGNNVDFYSNIGFDTGEASAQVGRGRNSGGNERDDYWVVYLQIAYQGDTRYDHDPNPSGIVAERTDTGDTPRYEVADTCTGVNNVPRGGDGSLIFVETLTDYIRFNETEDDAIEAAHEVGHQFGLKGDTQGNEYGIMSFGGGTLFVPAHLNILRWRVKSPGEPRP